MSATTAPAVPSEPAATSDPNLRVRAKASWALYDFANTIFSFAVVSGAIGLWLTDDSRFGAATGQAVLSIAIIVSVGINALVSPVLGALSDRGGRRLPFLLAFTALCIVPNAVIGLSGPVLGVTLFIIANFSYQAALIYYDASIKLVSTPQTRGRLSGIGTGIGYCGTVFVGLLIFFFDIPIEARFLLTSVLFALFAIPLFVIVRERPAPDAEKLTAAVVVASWQQLRTTIRHAKGVPGLPRFLVGRFFYSDAVNTVIVVMSVVAVEAVGLTATVANLILLSLTIVAIAMSFVWGAMTDRLGPRRTLMIVLASWAVGLVLGSISLSLNGTDPATGDPVPTAIGFGLFLFAGAILGSGLGGVQVADRVFMVRLSPPERVGEFFGIYGLVGKASQVIGQALYGAIVYLLLNSMGTGAYQVAILSLIVTMLIGLWLVRPVSDRWAGSGEVHIHGSDGGEPSGPGSGTGAGPGPGSGPVSGSAATRRRRPRVSRPIVRRSRIAGSRRALGPTRSPRPDHLGPLTPADSPRPGELPDAVPLSGCSGARSGRLPAQRHIRRTTSAPLRQPSLPAVGSAHGAPVHPPDGSRGGAGRQTERRGRARDPVELRTPLVPVAVGVRTSPGPGRADHLLEARAARLPAENLACPGVRRDEHRRVAGTARPHRVRDLVTRDRGGRLEHVPDREPA